MREVAAYLLFNKEKRVLLMHRTLDAPTNPDFWGFFGGGVKNSETPLEAVKREAIEELGIDLENVKFFKTYKQRDNRGLQMRHIFVGNLGYSLKELKKQQREGSGLNIFSVKELKNLKIAKNDFKIIQEVVKNI